MMRQTTCLDPTLLEVAEILGIEPEKALHWIIEGRLLVTQQDSQTVIRLETDRHQKSRKANIHLINKKFPNNRKKPTFSC